MMPVLMHMAYILRRHGCRPCGRRGFAETSTEVPGPTSSSVDTVVRSTTPLMAVTKTLTGTNDADSNGQSCN